MTYTIQVHLDRSGVIPHSFLTVRKNGVPQHYGFAAFLTQPSDIAAGGLMVMDYFNGRAVVREEGYKFVSVPKEKLDSSAEFEITEEQYQATLAYIEILRYKAEIGEVSYSLSNDVRGPSFLNCAGFVDHALAVAGVPHESVVLLPQELSDLTGNKSWDALKDSLSLELEKLSEDFSIKASSSRAFIATAFGRPVPVTSMKVAPAMTNCVVPH
jgi:hypothetical protein